MVESLDYAALNKALTPSNRKILEESVASALYSLLSEDTVAKSKVERLDNENEILRSENKKLKEELDASDRANEVAESVVLSQWSINKTINLGKKIAKIKENSEYDTNYKIRMALWTTLKRIGLEKDDKKKFKKFYKFDINDGYRTAAKYLTDKMGKTTDSEEMVSIRSIMRNINELHEEYSRLNNVTSTERKSNMVNINSNMRKVA